MYTVRSRQKRWLGHTLRHDSLLRITLEGQIQGDVLGLVADEEEDNYEELKMFAQDRSKWSHMAENCREIPSLAASGEMCET